MLSWHQPWGEECGSTVLDLPGGEIYLGFVGALNLQVLVLRVKSDARAEILS